MVTSCVGTAVLKHVTEGKMEEKIDKTGRRRWRKELRGDLKETRRNWKLQEEAVDRNLWRTCF